jgi:hypothetical protein
MGNVSFVTSNEISIAFFMESTHSSKVRSRAFSSSFNQELRNGVRSRQVPDTCVVLPTNKFKVIEFKALLNASDDCVVFGRAHYSGVLQTQRFGNWVSFGHQAFIEVPGTWHSTACSKAAVVIIIIVFITFIQGIIQLCT